MNGMHITILIGSFAMASVAAQAQSWCPFTVQGPVAVRQEALRLLDVTGREVLRMPYTGTDTVVDASALTAGPYILRLADEQGRVVHQRVIKQ